MSTLTLKTEFSDTQARKIAEAIDSNIEETKKENAITFVTKAELNETEKNITLELSTIKQDIAVIKNKLENIETNFATKADMSKLSS